MISEGGDEQIVQPNLQTKERSKEKETERQKDRKTESQRAKEPKSQRAKEPKRERERKARRKARKKGTLFCDRFRERCSQVEKNKNESRARV